VIKSAGQAAYTSLTTTTAVDMVG